MVFGPKFVAVSTFKLHSPLSEKQTDLEDHEAYVLILLRDMHQHRAPLHTPGSKDHGGVPLNRGSLLPF